MMKIPKADIHMMKENSNSGNGKGRYKSLIIILIILVVLVGDNDLIVGLQGMLFPNNDKIGSVVILENDGQMQFTQHEISNDPTHLLTCEPGDFNNDGLVDVVSGGMHTYPPYNRMSRITLWIHKGLIH